MQPLADDLGLEVDSDFKKSKTSELVDEIFDNPDYDGKMVLVCWDHHRIPDIEEAAGVENPEDWPDDVFDRTLVIDFDLNGKVRRFRNLPQNLLPGDSK